LDEVIEVRTFFLEKETGTLSDALAVFGLATLCGYLAELQGQSTHWQVEDEGPYFRIDLDGDINLERLPSEPPRLALGIRSGNRPDDELQGIPDVFDLNAEWERVRAFPAQRSQRQASGEDLAEMQPDSFFAVGDFIVWRLLQFRSSYHDLLRRWHALGPAFRETIKMVLQTCAEPPGPLGSISAAWTAAARRAGLQDTKADSTRLQALNPSQGKGLNRPKPTSVAVGNESGFWVLEYLKAAGLAVSAAPRRIRSAGGQQIDARKLYVVAPGRLRSDFLALVTPRFAKALRDDRPVKLDILAALEFARAMLQTQKEGQPRGEPWAAAPVPTLVLGLHTVTFQSLGQAAAVMNIGFLDTPAWAAAHGGDIDTYLGLVEEHIGVIGAIDEQGEGLELVRIYRQFVTSGQLPAFLDFCGRYGEFLLRSLAHNRRFLRRFTVGNLEVLMQSEPNLSEIVRATGFRALATAIRLSTVSPQYRQQMAGEGSLYDVRYGLGQDLVRHSVDKQKFAAKLSEFVQSYNAENARVYERRKEQRRRNIEVSELDDVFRLIDAYGPGLVARLLVAYGYARDPREPDVPQEDSPEAQSASA
jgi:hypothetical protein